MYKVFSGEKCILISGKEVQDMDKDTHSINFASAENLHKEYKHFIRASKMKTLVVIGEEERVWNVFQSLFANIYAAGGIVKNEDENLLMIYRNKHWDLPKGKMEKGESPDETALREVEEECGVKKLSIIKKISSTHHVYFLKGKECMKHTYWFEMKCKDSSKLVPQKEEGIEEAKWMSKDEVKKIYDKIYHSLLEVITASSFLSG
ncbi:MAG TPA: NUDIX domain-containing protein [Bacteroidia bacterium]